MATITIHDVDDALKQRLQTRAADHGQSIEDEAREILREALREGASDVEAPSLYDAIRNIVEPLGGIEIDLPVRTPVREPPKFD